MTARILVKLTGVHDRLDILERDETIKEAHKVNSE